MPGAGADARIVLIGPMPPHRGGIAQYGLRLHRALESIAAVTTFAFARQYPRWLYPGPSDIDPDGARVDGTDVRYTIDSLKPWTWFRTASAIAGLRPRALVIQWWTVFWWPAFALIAALVRRKGIPVVLLCHNVVDHESAGWKERLSAWMLGLADGYVVHSSQHHALLQARFPGRPAMLAPIPAYDDHARPAAAPGPRRGRLELLFFGFLRPYKGLDVLLDALELLDDPQVHLTVAGEPWDDARATVARLQRMRGDRLDLHLEFVPAALAAELFERADAVVLPYLAASGSAVTALAYSHDKPVVASRVGGLVDAVEEGRTGVFFEAGDARGLAQLLRDLDRGRLAAMSGEVARYRRQHGWEAFAGTLVQLAGQLTPTTGRKEDLG